MLRKLKPVENICLDNDRLRDLYAKLGPVGADGVISRAMEELAVRLARVFRAYDRGQLQEVGKTAHGITAIADQVGMMALASVARDVESLTTQNDGAALAAAVARLDRLGEKSLLAVWDLQDLSV